MRKALLLSLLAFSLLGSTAARADHRAVRFFGMHPIAAEYGGGFCYIEFPHVHVYDPQQPNVLYRHTDDGYAFVGDPVPYGYDGPKQAYYGPHPIVVEGDPDEYCYIEGPHYHSFAPVAQASFKLKGGVYYYAGDFPRAYVEMKPRYAKINAIYKPLHYARPVVVESPPPEYRGPVYVEPAPAAAVYVEPPVVSAGVGVGVGAGAHFEAGIGFHAGAGVVVGTPPPVYVAPAPVIVEERRPVYIDRRPVIIDRRPQVIEVRGKHDNGKHKGWGHH